MPSIRFDDGLASITDSSPWETVAVGFEFTEGPVWSDGALLFSDIPKSRIHQWDGAATSVFREPSGNSNGLTLDPMGALIACEQGNRRVSRQAADAPIETLASHYDGKRLNSPNDVVVRSDGRMYFTDPPYGIEEHERELPFNGVFSLDPSRNQLTLLLTDFERPNGLAFSPDERMLYIADTQRLHVRVFDVASDGTLSGGQVFTEMAERGRPDGIKVDRDGRVYVCAGTLQVFAADGRPLGVIDCPQSPANCAWGDDGSTLYITARTGVYGTRFGTIGVAPVLRTR